MFLLSSMDIKLCFPLVHFLCLDSTLASHRPDHVDDLGSFWYLVISLWVHSCPSFMAIELYPDCLNECVPVMAFHHLVPIQYVWVFRGCECDRVLECPLSCRLHGGYWYVFLFILVQEDFPRYQSLASLGDTLVVARCVVYDSTAVCLAC